MEKQDSATLRSLSVTNNVPVNVNKAPKQQSVQVHDNTSDSSTHVPLKTEQISSTTEASGKRHISLLSHPLLARKAVSEQGSSRLTGDSNRKPTLMKTKWPRDKLKALKYFHTYNTQDSRSSIQDKTQAEVAAAVLTSTKVQRKDLVMNPTEREHVIEQIHELEAAVVQWKNKYLSSQESYDRYQDLHSKEKQDRQDIVQFMKHSIQCREVELESAQDSVEKLNGEIEILQRAHNIKVFDLLKTKKDMSAVWSLKIAALKNRLTALDSMDKDRREFLRLMEVKEREVDEQLSRQSKKERNTEMTAALANSDFRKRVQARTEQELNKIIELESKKNRQRELNEFAMNKRLKRETHELETKLIACWNKVKALEEDKNTMQHKAQMLEDVQDNVRKNISRHQKNLATMIDRSRQYEKHIKELTADIQQENEAQNEKLQHDTELVAQHKENQNQSADIIRQVGDNLYALMKVSSEKEQDSSRIRAIVKLIRECINVTKQAQQEIEQQPEKKQKILERQQKAEESFMGCIISLLYDGKLPSRQAEKSSQMQIAKRTKHFISIMERSVKPPVKMRTPHLLSTSEVQELVNRSSDSSNTFSKRKSVSLSKGVEDSRRSLLKRESLWSIAELERNIHNTDSVLLQTEKNPKLVTTPLYDDTDSQRLIPDLVKESNAAENARTEIHLPRLESKILDAGGFLLGPQAVTSEERPPLTAVVPLPSIRSANKVDEKKHPGSNIEKPRTTLSENELVTMTPRRSSSMLSLLPGTQAFTMGKRNTSMVERLSIDAPHDEDRGGMLALRGNSPKITTLPSFHDDITITLEQKPPQLKRSKSCGVLGTLSMTECNQQATQKYRRASLDIQNVPQTPIHIPTISVQLSFQNAATPCSQVRSPRSLASMIQAEVNDEV